jgi:hypothetical protein
MNWLRFPLMMAEGGDGASGGGDGTPPPATGGDNPPANPPANPPENGKAADGSSNDEANPLLKKPAKTEEKPAEGPSDEDYLKAFKVNEGAKYEFDNDIMKDLVPIFKELNLSPEQSNKLANDYAAMTTARAEKDVDDRRARIEAWKPAIDRMVKDNPQLVAEANAAIEHYAKLDPVLEQLCRETELGCSPGFLALLADAGRTILSDGGTGTSAPGNSGAKTFAQIMSA